MERYCSCCCRKPVAPERFQCETCFEEGATKRICCNGKFCDHCYTKNKLCPRCKTPTRLEKMTGATYMLPIFSEHEECRICLDPGIKRRCCGNYYCDDCYFVLSKCRSCDQPVERKAFGMRSWGRAYILTILLGWLVTFIVAILIFIIVLVVALNEASTPIGITQFSCSGFFLTCNQQVCLDMPASVSNGISPIIPANQWRACTFQSQYKIEASACIFDQELFTITNNILGYDVCKNHFNQGIYTFEDNFENWRNPNLFSTNLMASAKWNSTFNAAVSADCGPGAAGSKNALVFFGQFHRYAITADFDLINGGRVEAELLLAPLSFDGTHPRCQAAFSGVVLLQYSIDAGVTWTEMAAFDPVVFRSETFFHIQVEVPVKSSHIRFQFIQPHFQYDRDNWALDNLRVLSYLPDAWATSDTFKTNVDISHDEIQFAQCCFDTDQCVKRLSESELEKCKTVPGFTGKSFSIREAEIIVLVATCLCIIKFIYVSILDYLVKRRFPFQDEIEEILLLDFIRSRIPARYRMKKDLDDYIGDVHRAARLNIDHMSRLKDEVGQGEVKIRTAEEVQTERKQVFEHKRKVLKKKIRRLKRDKAPTADLEIELEDLNALEEAQTMHPPVELNAANFMSASLDENNDGPTLTTEMDDLKRMNLSLLRIPFDTKVSYIWIYSFAIISCGVFTVIFLYKASTTPEYTLYASVHPYGLYTTMFSISSFGVNFFAFFCDLKEIYYILRFVVPIHNSWVPLITIDKSDDVNGLFIGKYMINLSDVTESQIFSHLFIYGSAAAYFAATIPLNLILLIIREQFLDYSIMRFMTPIIGVFILSRVILGPSYLIKIAFAIQYLFDMHFYTREKMGIAMKSEKVKLTAIVAASTASLLGVFVCSALAYEYAGIIFGLLIVVGLIYGSFAGCIHALPIRPWFVLTTLEAGTWLHVKKKQRCPCIYWCSCCTDVHVNDEMFVIFPTDDVKFFSVLKGSMGS